MKRTLAILAGALLAMSACKQQDNKKHPSQKPVEHTPSTSPTTPEKGTQPGTQPSTQPGDTGTQGKGDTRDQATPSTGDRMDKDRAGTPSSDPPGDPPGDKPTMGERPSTGDTSGTMGTDTSKPMKTYSFEQRDQMKTDMKQRLDMLDVKIGQLGAKSDPKTRRVLDDIKTKRDQLSKQIDQIDNQTAANWNDFQTRVDRNFKMTEKEVDVALKGSGQQGQTGSIQPGEGEQNQPSQQPKTEQGGEG